jgi:PadR family transcriptional regulator PadR
MYKHSRETAPRSESLRGALDLLVLRVLNTRPLHGYAIAKRIRDLTEDALRIEEGSLYPALYRMERAEWLHARWGRNENNRRVRVYELTSAGEQQLEAELTSWVGFTRAVANVVDSA